MSESNRSLSPIPPQEKACREAPKCCPFCGRQPSFTEWKDSKRVTENGTVCPEVWFAGCNCFFVKSFAHHGTRQEAIDAWNTRHPSLDDPTAVEVVARRLYECEANRARRVSEVLSEAFREHVEDQMEPWDACKNAFLSDAQAALAALKQRLGEGV